MTGFGVTAAVFLAGAVYMFSATAFSPQEHFHPKGKPPSKHTKAVLTAAAKALPFSDRRDFEARPMANDAD